MSFVNAPLIKPNTVEQRLYQMVMTGVAIQENALLVLPTGLGKTIIAILAGAYFLNAHPRSMIVVTAPTRPLVNQHLTSFRTILDIPEWEIVELSGSISASKRASIWRTARVVIATPQVLKNDIINDSVDLSRISFLCIDECHRMVGNDSTVLAAELYRQRNPEGRLIGITASPGKAEKMREILSHLGARRVEYRDETDVDVKPYVFERGEEVKYVELPESFKEILDILGGILSENLKVLKELGQIDSASPAKMTRTKLIKLMSTITSEREKFESDDEYFSSVIAASNALKVSHQLEQLETQGIPGLYDYLMKQKNIVKREGKKSVARFLNMPAMKKVYELTEQLYEQGEIHPKLKILTELVRGELERELSSRILVFSNYRKTVKTLSEELSKLDAVSCHWFVGQSSSDEDLGLKQRDQLQILEDFRSGRYNVLVSTSVAEEGLDVAQCDLVVFYDVVPSATRLIQRSGRTGRKRAGRVVLLVAKGTRDESYFYASQANRRRLRSAIDEIKAELQAEQDRMGQTSLDDFYSEDPDSSEGSESGEDRVEDTDGWIDEPSENLPVLTVDSREKATSIMRFLMMSDEVKIRTEQLPVGDYMVSDRMGVERKSVEDFVSTVTRGDLFEQLIQLKNGYSRPLMIIEGGSLYKSGLNERAIRGIISSILVDYQIPIIFTRDEEDTANYLIYLAYKEQVKEKRSPKVKTQRYHDSLAEEQISLVAQLPKINRRRAEELLRKFETPRNLFNQPQDELTKTPGIGKVIANRIDLLLNTPFEESKTE